MNMIDCIRVLYRVNLIQKRLQSGYDISQISYALVGPVDGVDALSVLRHEDWIRASKLFAGYSIKENDYVWWYDFTSIPPNFKFMFPLFRACINGIVKDSPCSILWIPPKEQNKGAIIIRPLSMDGVNPFPSYCFYRSKDFDWYWSAWSEKKANG